MRGKGIEEGTREIPGPMELCRIMITIKISKIKKIYYMEQCHQPETTTIVLLNGKKQIYHIETTRILGIVYCSGVNASKYSNESY